MTKTWKNLSCTWQAKISLGRAAAVSTSSSHFCHSALVVIDNLKEKQSNSLGNGKVYGASSGKMSSVIFADCFNFWLKSPFNNSWKTKLNSVFPSLSQTAPRVLKKWYIYFFCYIFIRPQNGSWVLFTISRNSLCRGSLYWGLSVLIRGEIICKINIAHWP